MTVRDTSYQMAERLLFEKVTETAGAIDCGCLLRQQWSHMFSEKTDEHTSGFGAITWTVEISCVPSVVPN